ncbi:hypothetical protein ACHAWF_008186 [Thalassiosira exigua]
MCTQSIVTLNNILENYRASHYSQELPRRFRKDIVNAATTSKSTGVVSAEGIEYVLNNIGAGNQMSHDEIEMILREIGGNNNGNENCVITQDQMLDLISNRAL